MWYNINLTKNGKTRVYYTRGLKNAFLTMLDKMKADPDWEEGVLEMETTDPDRVYKRVCAVSWCGDYAELSTTAAASKKARDIISHLFLSDTEFLELKKVMNLYRCELKADGAHITTRLVKAWNKRSAKERFLENYKYTLKMFKEDGIGTNVTVSRIFKEKAKKDV